MVDSDLVTCRAICDFAEGVWGSGEEEEQERMEAKRLEMPLGCLQMEKKQDQECGRYGVQRRV